MDRHGLGIQRIENFVYVCSDEKDWERKMRRVNIRGRDLEAAKLKEAWWSSKRVLDSDHAAA